MKDEFEIHEYLDGAIRITRARTGLLLVAFLMLMTKGTYYTIYKVHQGKLMYLKEGRK